MTQHSINLLPWHYRRRCLLRRRLRQWSIAWAAVAIALAAGWLDQYGRWQTALAELEMHEQRYDEIRTVKSEIARLRAQQQNLGKQQNLVSQLQQAPPPLLALALVSGSAARCEGRVAVGRLAYGEEAVMSAPAAASPAPPAGATPPGGNSPPATAARPAYRGRLTIDGIGADNVAIAEFVLGLRESGVFERVDLKSAAASTSRAMNVTAYQVECGL